MSVAVTLPPGDPPVLAKLRNEVLDTLLFAMSAIGLPAFAAAQLRALELGWGLRELVQVLVYASLLGMTARRHQVSPRFKANFLMLLFLVISLPGALTLGVFAGGVFFLPVPLFIAAQFYQLRPTIVVGLLVTGVLLLAAVGYTAGGWGLPVTADALLHSPLNWGVYVSSFCLLAIYIAAAIRRYREVVEQLLQAASEQHDALMTRNHELEQALAEIRTLRGIIPICSWCHKIRDDDAGAWKQLESYITAHSDAQFSHGICPGCASRTEAEL